MKKKAILFDFDGTIADSIPWILKEINNHAVEYCFQPIPSKEFSTMRSSTLAELVKQFNISLFKLPFFIATMRREVKKDINKMGLCAGIKELLLKLKKRGLRMGVVSSSPRENIEAFLLRHDLNMFELDRDISNEDDDDTMICGMPSSNRANVVIFDILLF